MAIAANPGRNGEVLFVGQFPNKATTLIGVLKRLAERHGRIECTYKAGPCADTLDRQLTHAGIHCMAVAPFAIPMACGRVKNDHRDPVSLARLLRADDRVGV